MRAKDEEEDFFGTAGRRPGHLRPPESRLVDGAASCLPAFLSSLYYPSKSPTDRPTDRPASLKNGFRNTTKDSGLASFLRRCCVHRKVIWSQDTRQCMGYFIFSCLLPQNILLLRFFFASAHCNSASRIPLRGSRTCDRVRSIGRSSAALGPHYRPSFLPSFSLSRRHHYFPDRDSESEVGKKVTSDKKK